MRLKLVPNKAIGSISRCESCPYCGANLHIKDDGHCYAKSQYIRDVRGEIPWFCPLPDAEHTGLPYRCNDCSVEPKGKSALCSICHDAPTAEDALAEALGERDAKI